VPHLGVRGDGDDLGALDAKYVADTHRPSQALVRG